MVQALELCGSELFVFALSFWARVECTILCLVLVHNLSVIVVMLPISLWLFIIVVNVTSTNLVMYT